MRAHRLDPASSRHGPMSRSGDGTYHYVDKMAAHCEVGNQRFRIEMYAAKKVSSKE
jgi:ribosomal protein L37E